ncbi:MAG: SDR family oxidoreductase [Acaryochloris sp. RU_4_1]|nr:SDR family oxidoreductase [Acaryochloris sp. SU_5_25]NJM64652.1 SDR family oxidoreductase [Acaryochloris sp. RU_4_1]
MNLLVIGATGTLGRQIVRRALDEGHEVTCLVRTPRAATFLREWGASLVKGDLREPPTLKLALEGNTVVIDAATVRATDSLSIHEVDWEGKVALIQAAKAAGIQRYVFISILGSEKYPQVPLMDIKHCTELFLQESGLNYTILRPCGFFQGLIGQYAIPILEKQSVWVMDEASPTAYMDTQDIAKFAVNALSHSETERKTYDLAGPQTWSPEQLVELCEKFADQDAKVTRMSMRLLKGGQKMARFFQWSWNIADRLAFSEVLTAKDPITVPMAETYKTFGINENEITTLEAYMQEYFDRILKKLKQIEYEESTKQGRKRSPFKTPRSS